MFTFGGDFLVVAFWYGCSFLSCFHFYVGCIPLGLSYYLALGGKNYNLHFGNSSIQLVFHIQFLL